LTLVLDQSLRLWSKSKVFIAIVLVLQSLSVMLTMINDDGGECEKVDIIQIKTVLKYM